MYSNPVTTVPKQLTKVLKFHFVGSFTRRGKHHISLSGTCNGPYFSHFVMPDPNVTV